MSRTDARSTSLRHRPARTVPATIVATVLVLLGVGLVWVAVLRLSDGRWPGFLGAFASSLLALTWTATLTLAVAVALVVVGLVLLMAALTPGQPNAMILTDQTDQTGQAPEDGVQRTEYVMTRRSVAKLATAHADLVDGVDKVSAAAGARWLRLQVRTGSEQTGDVETLVTDQVRDALTAAGLKPVPRISTTVRTTKP